MIIRGRVHVRELYQGTMRFGAPSTLRFQDGKVVDTATGRLVPTEPFIDPPAKKASNGLLARLVRFFWMED